MKTIALIILTILLTQAETKACNQYNLSDLTKQKWTQIKIEMKNSSMSLNRKQITYSTVSQIIGDNGNCKVSATGRVKNCLWISENCKKKIKAIFSDNNLTKITKSGF